MNNILLTHDRPVNSLAMRRNGRIVHALVHIRQECVDASPTDSCTRLAPYCSLVLVKYDISCGGQFLESVGCVTCWAASTV